MYISALPRPYMKRLMKGTKRLLKVLTVQSYCSRDERSTKSDHHRCEPHLHPITRNCLQLTLSFGAEREVGKLWLKKMSSGGTNMVLQRTKDFAGNIGTRERLSTVGKRTKRTRGSSGSSVKE